MAGTKFVVYLNGLGTNRNGQSGSEARDYRVARSLREAFWLKKPAGGATIGVPYVGRGAPREGRSLAQSKLQELSILPDAHLEGGTI